MVMIIIKLIMLIIFVVGTIISWLKSGIGANHIIASIIVMIMVYIIGGLIRNYIFKKLVKNNKKFSKIKIKTAFLFDNFKKFSQYNNLKIKLITKYEKEILCNISNDLLVYYQSNICLDKYDSIEDLLTDENYLINIIAGIEEDKKKNITKYFNSIKKIKIDVQKLDSLYIEYLDGRLLKNRSLNGLSLFVTIISVLSFSITLYLNIFGMETRELLNIFVLSPLPVAFFYLVYSGDYYREIEKDFDFAEQVLRL